MYYIKVTYPFKKTTRKKKNNYASKPVESPQRCFSRIAYIHTQHVFLEELA